MGETMSKRLKFHLGGEAEMEERAFTNPFPDYEAAASAVFAAGAAEDTGCARPQPTTDELGLPFHNDGKIIHNFTRRIQTKIKDLLQQMEEGLKTADPHDCSAYTGWTGIALLYLQLYRVTCDQTYLLRSLDYVKRTLRNLNGRRVTFLCGDAGPLAVGAVVYHKLKSDCESQECITKLLQLQKTIVCRDSDLPDELLYGRAGYLYALLYLNTEIGPGTVCESAIKEVVNAIIESGKTLSREERKADRCPLLYQWHRKQYVGAAHGMAGIYYMLMQPAAKVDQETLTEMVKPSIDYVRHKRFRSGNYPSSLSNETDRLVHWCHGAPGVIHMLTQAYKVFKEEKYLKEAMECSDVIWQRGLLRKGYGICHGTAGNGYSFLSLYHLTQDKKYLYRACKFAEWCLEYGAHGCRIPDRPYSLFEGMAGAIHFLSDILVPETSRFPAFELAPSQRDKKMQ
ncbi:lanC-like protein 2 [Panthera pardus]|uniref:LanC-like protein 2 n=2 Tax=Panthera TaxID=9688 RepID=A0A8C9D550_PANLE|nr:lanC-like protein 2 [Panthera tigris]XP_019306587.1 lanC-like protein 2 [Panthera pardus]XP_042770079.1 lanC-like protein 2 [Panthera leo]XP_049497239.1 lanC-like protein 2 [Panthera uncia]